jgi:hypothetical protein
VRVPIVLAGLASVAALLLAPGVASPSTQAAKRVVTVQLTNSGVGSWSLDGPDDKATLALRYNWHGTLKFTLPARVLKDPGKTKFKVNGRTTLLANWDGVYDGRKLTGLDQGPYKCTYKGANVAAPVTATLQNGKRKGTLKLTLHPRTVSGTFFPMKGEGATANCTTGRGADGPPHFGPNWLFRDTVTDQGALTADTAIINISSKLLPRRSVTVVFPREVGKRNSDFTGNLRWNNRGRLVVRAR